MSWRPTVNIWAAYHRGDNFDLMAPQNAKRRIEVGDEVIRHVGPMIRIPCRVVEDRGNLGVGGARVLGLMCDMGEEAHEVYRETAEHKLELVERAA
jgi:hypothetical protein